MRVADEGYRTKREALHQGRCALRWSTVKFDRHAVARAALAVLVACAGPTAGNAAGLLGKQAEKTM
eukprot:13184597-Alexandrium_andersonii.AAC.1